MQTSRKSRQRTLVVGLILVGLILVGVFGFRAARAFREFRRYGPPPPLAGEPAETDVELIRDWMTIPFIAQMYHVPGRVLFRSLDIPEHNNKEKSLKQLNDEYYPEAEGIVLAKVKAAVLANQPPPLPTVPATPTLP